MAAEYGAAFGIKADPDSFSSSGEACDTVAGSGLTEGDRLDWGWVDVDVPDEGLDYDLEARIVGCNDDRGLLYISWGRVVNSSDILVSERFVVFSDVGLGGGPDRPSIDGTPIADLPAPLTCTEECDPDEWDGEVDGRLDGANFTPPGAGCSGNSCWNVPSDEESGVLDFSKEVEYAEWEDFLSGVEFSDITNVSDSSYGSESNPVAVEVLEDFSITGNVDSFGIIVVRSGARLTLSGTQHHEGLIVIEKGGGLEMSGTSRIYGGVVAFGAVSPNDIYQSQGQGQDKTPVRYSYQALERVGRVFGDSSGNPVWQNL